MNQTQFSKFSFDTVLVLLESSDRFPVDFDAAWQWLGYHRKDAAKEKLTRNFERDFDYSAIWRSVAHSSGFTASKTEVIMLSIDCFNYYAVSPPSEFCTQNQWRDIRRLIRIASNIVFLHSKDKY